LYCSDVAVTLLLPLLSQGRFRFNWQPQSQRIYYGTAIDSEGRTVDEVLLLAMLRPRSYTREDVIELHTHGGGVCAQRVLRACIEAGARPARPGEFTLRAFLNGRMDLSQVCDRYTGCVVRACCCIH
jgi:tRNA modification GTPase